MFKKYINFLGTSMQFFNSFEVFVVVVVALVDDDMKVNRNAWRARNAF